MRKNDIKIWGLLFAIGLMAVAAPVGAEDEFYPGRVNLGGGGTWPVGSYDKYVNGGFTVTGRIIHDFPSLVSVWSDINLISFSEKRSLAEPGQYRPGTIPVEQKISQLASSVHAGLGINYSRGAVRPRILVGPAFHLFFTSISVRDADAVASDEDYKSVEFSDVQGRFGWRALIGCDILVSSKWGIGLDVFHETVWHLHRSSLLGEHSGTSRFIGFAVGVVFPFDAIKKKIREEYEKPQDYDGK